MKLQKVTHASHKLLLREPVTYTKHLKVSNFFLQNMFTGNSNFEANIHSLQCFWYACSHQLLDNDPVEAVRSPICEIVKNENQEDRNSHVQGIQSW